MLSTYRGQGLGLRETAPRGLPATLPNGALGKLDAAWLALRKQFLAAAEPLRLLLWLEWERGQWQGQGQGEGQGRGQGQGQGQEQGVEGVCIRLFSIQQWQRL